MGHRLWLTIDSRSLTTGTLNMNHINDSSSIRVNLVSTKSLSSLMLSFDNLDKPDLHFN